MVGEQGPLARGIHDDPPDPMSAYLGAKYGWEELVGDRERNQFDVALGLERRF